MEDEKISRRKVLGGLGTGLAAMAVSPVFSEHTGSKDVGAAAALEDPLNKYPKPPFNGQSQPWPGLAGKMDPRPDHGEKSYKGSGRLSGRNLVR